MPWESWDYKSKTIRTQGYKKTRAKLQSNATSQDHKSKRLQDDIIMRWYSHVVVDNVSYSIING